MKAFFERAAVVRRFVLMISLCWLALAATGAWASPASGALGATLLPAEGDPQRSQLAVSWSGEAGATLSVARALDAGTETILLSGHALDRGVNLLALPLPADATGALELRAHTADGVVAQTLDMQALRGDAFFAWESMFVGPGFDGGASVGLGGGRTMIVWDDGNGPALYVGGGFVTAGSKRVDRIARWDGTGWSPLTGPLGTGINMDGSGNPSVKALAVHEGDLIVAGFFDNAGGVSVDNIARWDGTAWSALGEGLTGVIGVEALAVYNGELVAGGSFTQSGAATVNRVARWNGTQWLPLGTGVSVAEFNQTVQVWALTVFNGELVAGGNFLDAGGVTVNRIARWNGTAWNALGLGVSQSANPESTLPAVYVFTIMHGELIVGGNFRQAGGQPAGAVARWNGTAWTALGTGVDGTGSVRVLALAVQGSDLYAGGSFATAGGASASNVARWNGTQWSALSGPNGNGTLSAVEDLGLFQGQLIAVGIEFGQAGGVNVNGLARWTGTEWATLDGAPGAGVLGNITASTIYNGELVIAGNFGRAGGETVFAIARWDGSAWRALHGPFAAGINAPPGAGVSPGVEALTVFNGELIVGGRFLDAGGVFVRHIARWDGTRWWPLGPDGTGVEGGGPSPGVRALTVYDGALIVGGVFSTVGGTSASNIARWDGTTWTALGAGVDSSVESLHAHDGALIAGGNFSQAGGAPASGIARWDGSAWSALGSGTNGGVLALESYNGELIAAGNFNQAGGQTVERVARWNGSSWSGLTGASGTGVDGQALALGVYAGQLFVGGRFNHAGGHPVNAVARWDGSEWHPMVGVGGAGVGGWGLPEVQTFSVLDLDGAGPGPDKLVAAGRFHLTGGVANWSVGVYGPGEALAVLDVDLGTLDFGTVLVGWPAPSQTVTLSSVGSATVQINGVPAAAAPFERVGGSCPAGGAFDLPPLASCTLEYAFVPTAHGSFAQSILIDADIDGGKASFNLVGNGLIEQRPPILGTGAELSTTIPEGQTQALPLAIDNNGDQTLTWALSEAPFASATGFGDTINALAVWDDGNGPALYAAGEDDSGFRGVARWDGERWWHVGPGMNNDVTSLIVYDGALIAGGLFTQAGGVTVSRLARWDGHEWTALLHGVAGSSTARVNALAVFNGDLIAAGNFTEASGVPVNAIARWDGTQWSALGAGLGNQVAALAVHDGVLIAGGTFNTGGFSRIARWDGSSWSAMAGGVASTVLSLGVHDGDLIAGGAFTTAGGQPASRIARWDGTAWSALGAGVNNQVSTLMSFDGALYAGGLFTDSGGTPVARVARWDGSVWSALGSGVGARASAMAVFDGALHVGGSFVDAGGIAVDHLARWDGGAWSALTPGEPIDCTLPDWASVDPASGSVVGGDTQAASVTFDSTGLADGDYAGLMCLTSNDTGQPVRVIALELTVGDPSAGDLIVSPTQTDFGSVPAGVSAGPAMVAVVNTGGEALTVTAIDAPAAPFMRNGGDCAAPPFDLDPGASCQLGYVFAPTTTGAFEQALAVTSSNGNATITLRGTGIAVFPAQLILLSGDDQSATVGTPFAVPLAVQVRDDFNNPVPNIGVTFVAPEEGASAVLSQTTVMTDGNGYAAVNATANGIAGSYVVTAFGGLGAPVEFSLSNVSASPDLAVSIVASREHVRPGQLLDYVISVHNLGPDATSQADVLSTLSPLLDLSATSWQCLGPTASGCTAAGQGNLADDGLSLPAQGSVLYALRSAVPLQGEEGPVETAATVVAPGDANPGNDSAAALTSMVLYRHGFELYGDGASALEPAVDSLAADDEATLVWPATVAALVDTALLALADDGTGVRVDRLAAGTQGWARLVAIAADGRERAGAWTPVPAGAELTLAFADTAADGEQPATRTALLLGAGVELRIALDGLSPSYRVRSAMPLEIGDGETR